MGSDAEDRGVKVLLMRRDGYSFREIAAITGIPLMTAYEAYRKAMSETIVDLVEDVRKLEIEKLDAMERRAHEVLARGDDKSRLAANTQLLKIHESRRRFLGLDAATKVEVSGGVRYEVVGVNDADLT